MSEVSTGSSEAKNVARNRPGGFDSRAWTGPEPQPPKIDPRPARAAFAQAGGASARLPQRVASGLVALGVVLLLGLALLQPAVLDPWPVPGFALERFREGWTASGLGALMPLPTWTITGNDIRVLLLGLTLLAASAGVVLAWCVRRALARGFEAAESVGPHAVFVTHPVDLLAPLACFCVLSAPLGSGSLSLLLLLLLGLLARLVSRAMTAIAERRFAGLPARSNRASHWDAASLAAGFGALAAGLVYGLSA